MMKYEFVLFEDLDNKEGGGGRARMVLKICQQSTADPFWKQKWITFYSAISWIYFKSTHFGQHVRSDTGHEIQSWR